MKPLTINPRFQNALPALSETEYAGLEQSIIKDGCYDAIAVTGSIIVDGHNRFELCQKHNKPFTTRNVFFGSEAETELWIRETAGSKRNLTEYDKYENELKTAELLKQIGKDKYSKTVGRPSKKSLSLNDNDLPKHNTQQQIATRLGWSTGKTAKADFVMKHADEETKEAVKKNNKTFAEAYKITKTKIVQKEEAKRKSVDAVEINRKDVQLHNCDINDAPIKDNSIDVIITDPPYPKEFLPCWSKLAEFATKTLKQGGVLIAACGHIYMPEVLDLMNVDGLNYHWMGCLYQPKVSADVPRRKIRTNWKPLLVYVKGNYKRTYQGTDVYVSKYEDTANGKDFHKWGQNYEVFSKIVTDWSYAKDVVCDPFLGGGTTGVAAIKNKRKFIGIEIDKKTYNVANARIAEVL